MLSATYDILHVSGGGGKRFENWKCDSNNAQSKFCA